MLLARNPKMARYATRGVLAVVIMGVVLNGSVFLDPARNQAATIQQAAATVPALFFIAGIWMIERAFKAITLGEAVEAALSILLQRLGFCLFVGGLSFVFAQPLLTKVLLGTSAWAWFDVPAITLGCLGLLLIVLARPLREAAEARSELEEIL
jgi:hypothetical protein